MMHIIGFMELKLTHPDTLNRHHFPIYLYTRTHTHTHQRNCSALILNFNFFKLSLHFERSECYKYLQYAYIQLLHTQDQLFGLLFISFRVFYFEDEMSSRRRQARIRTSNHLNIYTCVSPIETTLMQLIYLQ